MGNLGRHLIYILRYDFFLVPVIYNLFDGNGLKSLKLCLSYDFLPKMRMLYISMGIEYHDQPETLTKVNQSLYFFSSFIDYVGITCLFMKYISLRIDVYIYI